MSYEQRQLAKEAAVRVVINRSPNQWGYAVNKEGTSAFETLWEERRSSSTENGELEYDFFSGGSGEGEVVGLNNILAVSLQNRKREEKKKLSLQEDEAAGALLGLNSLKEVVSNKVSVKSSPAGITQKSSGSWVSSFV